MPLKAGTNFDALGFADSMAATMIQSFKDEWPLVMGDDIPLPESLDQMKLLFTAVAQGVVKHLQQHAKDFKVTVNGPSSIDYTGTVTQID
ncbi:MAG: hypothetical protein J7621_19535 [Niastella sp.]|nr:hypothetical protein [Niastella sp.]